MPKEIRRDILVTTHLTMPPQTSYTAPITELQASALERLLRERSYDFGERPYSLFSAKGDRVQITVYTKGPKVLIQGKNTENFVRNILEPEILGEARLDYEEIHHPERFSPHFGIDESGKGDFFGPLVIAGVYVDSAIAHEFVDQGIRDSKRIKSTAQIRALAQRIRTQPGVLYEELVLTPPRYNALYERIGNLNRLLAWGHAQVIAQLHARRPDCPRALSDQFARSSLLERALGKKTPGLQLEQRTKAEDDPAVAAASILARECFVTWFEKQSKTLGIELPRGASRQTQETFRDLRERDPQNIARLGKMHFRFAAEPTDK